MIEPKKNIDRASPAVTRAPQFNPDDLRDVPNFEKVTASVAGSLRPPELQFFGDQGGLGAPRFERQAIVGMDMLKANPQETTLNNLSALLVDRGADIEKYGTDDAREGLRVLDEFLGNSALLLAIQKNSSN
jgi:hypothetical protein